MTSPLWFWVCMQASYCEIPVSWDLRTFGIWLHQILSKQVLHACLNSRRSFFWREKPHNAVQMWSFIVILSSSRNKPKTKPLWFTVEMKRSRVFMNGYKPTHTGRLKVQKLYMWLCLMITVINSKHWLYMAYPVLIEYIYIHIYIRLKRH